MRDVWVVRLLTTVGGTLVTVALCALPRPVVESEVRPTIECAPRPVCPPAASAPKAIVCGPDQMPLLRGPDRSHVESIDPKLTTYEVSCQTQHLYGSSP